MLRRRFFALTSSRAELERGYRRFIAARPGEKLAVVKGQDASRFTDIYHAVLGMSWPIFFIFAAAVFVFLNVLFALLYRLDASGIAHAHAGSYWDDFQYSVQTMASISSPMAAHSIYVRLLTLAEAFIGIVNLAMLTGLIFARFARPYARVVFSNLAIVTPFDGVPTLMFRAANQRGNQILDASVTVALVRQSMSREGIVMRRLEELPLVRSRSQLFALSWTIMHSIDETSPLYGVSRETLEAGQAEIFVLLSGRDDSVADTIYARFTYRAADIVWGQRFVDVLSLRPDGRRVVDLTRFHETESVDEVWQQDGRYAEAAAAWAGGGSA